MIDAKKYIHLRIEDKSLARKIKSRAALEDKNLTELIEQALREYLRKPIVRENI